MLTVKPLYTDLHKLYCTYHNALSHTVKKKKCLPQKGDVFTYIGSADLFPQLLLLTNPLHRGGDSMGVCVCLETCTFNMCLHSCLKMGRRRQETVTSPLTERHSRPPPHLCGVAIIKMIYLTIGPRLRD
ncbi:hypothetical protein XENORESO_013160 [Xenotaenia resolanae]|uniref:Uncharacterized protein n=1 Tax=Xenotaenia resolanae TaxID=208358 RepID=A0ABV0WA54_9TELE